MQEDVRLAIFQAYLNEDWPVGTLVCYLRARVVLSQPAPVVFIQYSSKEGCWLCLAKALWIADMLLGPRTSILRARFELLLQRCALQV